MRGSNRTSKDEDDDDEFIPEGPMYRNASSFHRSYMEMEKKLKVYVYKEGEPPVFHFGPCKHTYAIEGYFIQAMDVSPFRTYDPDEAHLFFLPFSVTMLTEVVYIRDSHDWSLMKNAAFDYVNVVAGKHPFWNRSRGADHFMLACHDWASNKFGIAGPKNARNSTRRRSMLEILEAGLARSRALIMRGSNRTSKDKDDDDEFIPEGAGNFVCGAELAQQLHSRVVQCQHLGEASNKFGIAGPKNARNSTRRRSKLEILEAGLARSRALIMRGSNRTSKDEDDDDEFIPEGPMYRNASSFHRSYMEMEKKLKVYVYKEGEPPVFHFGPCKHTYAIEGYFIQAMDVSPFRTYDPDEAHLFFLPFSVTMLTEVVYIRDSHDWSLMKNAAFDYVNVVAGKHPFWNRSRGADHFMLACHDWGPEISFAVPNLHNNSIRALCNANTSERFDPERDVSIPEIHLPLGTTTGLLGGPPPSSRSVLVFYSGGLHGPIRPILMEHWGNNEDKDVQIHSYLPKGQSYYDMMRKSRYCICPSGYEVASPRMVEALYTGCVPVLIKEGYVVPFSDVLNVKTFAVILKTKDIPNLKKILSSIPEKKYLRMQKRGIMVRKHFEINNPPKRFDVFHMILHSTWLRRLNFRLRDNLDHDNLL
ncbi:hypothetical protein DM860_007642 [Cuscuta australis]|uniref:Exostosin GT47 domain-containing protein n=1 Tax=Cuscuta australis TaxID=267555 RepID=A0A328E4H9_9ASTE|nr:hypothetical protein DM860_007642 [Cuscuta australis]